MRIILLANRDIASLVAINHLLEAQPSHLYHILLSESVGNKPKVAQLNDLAFFEQRLFTDMLFPAIESVSPDDKSAKQAKLLTFNQLQQRGIRVNTITDINNLQGVTHIAALKPHLIISIRFGQILQPQVIVLPEYGVINLHSGKIPQYRGVMATFWAMLNEEQEIATTLHFIDDARIDAGRIISQRSQSINPQQCYLQNVISLYPAGVQDISKVMTQLAAGKEIKSQTIDTQDGQYYGFPDEDALHRFTKKGYKLVDPDYLVSLGRQFHPSSE